MGLEHVRADFPAGVRKHTPEIIPPGVAHIVQLYYPAKEGSYSLKVYRGFMARTYFSSPTSEKAVFKVFQGNEKHPEETKWDIDIKHRGFVPRRISRVNLTPGTMTTVVTTRRSRLLPYFPGHVFYKAIEYALVNNNGRIEKFKVNTKRGERRAEKLLENGFELVERDINGDPLV